MARGEILPAFQASQGENDLQCAKNLYRAVKSLRKKADQGTLTSAEIAQRNQLNNEMAVFCAQFGGLPLKTLSEMTNAELRAARSRHQVLNAIKVQNQNARASGYTSFD